MGGTLFSGPHNRILTRIIVGHDEIDLGNIKKAYQLKYKSSLSEHIDVSIAVFQTLRIRIFKNFEKKIDLQMIYILICHVAVTTIFRA